MKHSLLLFFIVLLSLSASSQETPNRTPSRSRGLDYRPTVVKGRTWWYYCAENGGRSDVYEFGLRVGDKVRINGQDWYEVSKVLSGDYYETGTVSFDSEPMLVGYIREESRTLYSRLIPVPDYRPLEIYYETSVIHGTYDTEIKVCRYGSMNDVFEFGTPSENIGLEITGVDEVENSGNTFRRFTSRCLSDGTCVINDDLQFVEGIGFTDTGESSDLFYFPLGIGFMSTPYLASPKLRYVTEGDDNNIIYENMGGRCLWADYLGVDAVVSEPEAAPVEWFNLQGISVSDPSVPGIYLRRQGSEIRKVVVH